MDFAILADHRVKMKENKMINKYLELARELRKPWNMVIPIIVGALGMVPKGLERVLEELEIRRIKTIQRMVENSQNTKKSPTEVLSLKLQ